MICPCSSVDEGEDALAGTDGGTEFSSIPLMNSVRARDEVGSCPDGEDPGHEGACGECKASPLYEFAEVVGTGDVAVEAARRQVVARVAGLTQVSDHVVGM